MKIELKHIPIRDVVKNYVNNDEEGVVGYSGKLNIRPKYQREFIYEGKERDDVLKTIEKDFPLNVMYWMENPDGAFEVLDGQQRTMSICEYVDGKFSINERYFHSLTDHEQNQILNYKLMIYFCKGNDKERLDWFRTINIAGKPLSDQELLNATYTGTWITDAKRHFSKTGCAGYEKGKNYLKGKRERQEYLETVIKWISNDNIEKYMSKNQHEDNANDLWLYFQRVINWIQVLFPNYRKEMKGIEWGRLYNELKDKKYDSKKLEERISELMQDDDVNNKKGIYEYVLSGKERCLSIRAFSDTQKREAYEKHKGICANFRCEGKGKKFETGEMEADHITPWAKGGKTIPENCQMLCRDCNRRKSGK